MVMADPAGRCLSNQARACHFVLHAHLLEEQLQVRLTHMSSGTSLEREALEAPPRQAWHATSTTIRLAQ